MIPNVVEHLQSMFQGRVQPRLARSVNASAVGHPCARCLVFDQVRTVEGDADLQPIFALGNTLERQAMIDLAEALAGTGMSMIQQQTPIPHNAYGIGGIVDGFLEYRDPDGKRVRVPCEFKSCSPFTYDEVDTFDDLRNHKAPWVRKWPAQLTIYLLLTNSPEGMFLLRNKVTGRYKQINVPLDYEYAEGLIKKAELVTAAVAAYRAAPDDEKVQHLPPRIPFDPVICEGCSHYSACIPDPNSLPEADARLWDVHLDALCRRADELKPLVKEHDECMDQIKAHAKSTLEHSEGADKRTTITDGFFITASRGQTTAYEVPDDIKKQYKTSRPTVRVTIKKIGSDQDAV